MLSKQAESKQEGLEWLKMQLVEIQTQLAFQEDTIHALNEVVTRQQRQMDQLQELCNSQKSELEQLASEVSPGGAAERPPHY